MPRRGAASSSASAQAASAAASSSASSTSISAALSASPAAASATHGAGKRQHDDDDERKEGAAALAAGAADGVKVYECPDCTESYTCEEPGDASQPSHTPRLLPCGHELCSACTLKYLKSKPGYVLCPAGDGPQAIRAPAAAAAAGPLSAAQWLAQVPKNRFVIQLMKVQRKKQRVERGGSTCTFPRCARAATHFCVQCSSELCAAHERSIHAAFLSAHERISLDEQAARLKAQQASAIASAAAAIRPKAREALQPHQDVAVVHPAAQSNAAPASAARRLLASLSNGFKKHTHVFIGLIALLVAAWLLYHASEHGLKRADLWHGSNVHKIDNPIKAVRNKVVFDASVKVTASVFAAPAQTSDALAAHDTEQTVSWKLARAANVAEALSLKLQAEIIKLLQTWTSANCRPAAGSSAPAGSGVAAAAAAAAAVPRPATTSGLMARLSDGLIKHMQRFIGADVTLGRARLLYRASRDGFAAADIWPRIEGKANSLILVETRNGFVFGAYTPVKWPTVRTAVLQYVADPSGRTCLFSLVNTHARPFRLSLMDRKHSLSVHKQRGPGFGGGADLRLMSHAKIANAVDGCDTEPQSFALDQACEAAAGLPPLPFAYDKTTLAGDDRKGEEWVDFAAAEIECWQL